MLYSTSVDGFGTVDTFSAMINYGVMAHWTNKDGYQGMRAFVFDKSAFMRDRVKSPDFALTELRDKTRGESNKSIEWGAALLAETDNLTAIPAWMGAYNKQINEGKTEYEAIRFADTVIDRAIGSGRKIDTASLFR